MVEEHRVIPGYERYVVSSSGEIRNAKSGHLLRQYDLNGYKIIDAYVSSGLVVTLPVHRAVALAWVDNPDPEVTNMVNHKDGDKLNNHFTNLEWVDCSGNNYHAVNTGLRADNVECEVRDYFTKDVKAFSSLAQAAEFVGMKKDTPVTRLMPKQFGKLVSGRYEIRYKENPKPWFYENRELIKPVRFIIFVTHPDGFCEEFYSKQRFRNLYKLHNLAEASVPALVELARERFPGLRFTFRDAYSESQKLVSARKLSKSEPVKISKGEDSLTFTSLTKCAMFFSVDRSSIQNRLEKGGDLEGWTISRLCPDTQ